MAVRGDGVDDWEVVDGAHSEDKKMSFVPFFFFAETDFLCPFLLRKTNFRVLESFYDGRLVEFRC